MTAETPDALAAFENDWRGRFRGRALCVARPGSTAEVAAVVRACAQARAQGLNISIVPQGGNTGLVMGSTPDDSGLQVVLSLQRMNRVRGLDAANMTITVEAGCILQNVQQAARDAGFWFPLSLAAEGSCTIGGNLGTNAGGTQVLRFGNTRDLCLGLEVVTAQGEILEGLTGLRKDNTGYDLRHLMIGSEGTLGIITAATMKLVPVPAASLTAWAALPSLEAASEFLGLAQKKLASSLTGFEVMGQFALSLVVKHFPQQKMPLWPGSSQDAPYSVVLEVSDAENEQHARAMLEALMEQALESEIISDAVISENIAQAKALWHIRESIPLAQAQEGLNIKHDISLPVSRIAAFCEKTDAMLREAHPGVRLLNFGHLGDGNLHYNVQCPEGANAKEFLRDHESQINKIVYDSVLSFGGSISAEHGVGSLKRDELPHYKSAVALSMMKSIKQALDPQGLLNPGRVI
ncbi:FAD-binding oxidoreductase [Variovorax sp. PCZ-1]|uniref:FAD-binding oxidoreductase n=1 Tax=Variovorax sp. PCZ-1 TaxID=2835533 RepID=UPI0020BF15E1|nr:FAD-binding oxidoreductase [Variovorax sp. PCZ-1]